MFYLQFGSSSFDEATDDLLHPLGVPHVDRRLLELRHLEGDSERSKSYYRLTFKRTLTRQTGKLERGRRWMSTTASSPEQLLQLYEILQRLQHLGL